MTVAHLKRGQPLRFLPSNPITQTYVHFPNYPHVSSNESWFTLVSFDDKSMSEHTSVM